MSIDSRKQEKQMLKFYLEHPEQFSVQYLAQSRITGDNEVCSDHPIVTDIQTGKVIFDGIPDVDRIGMFAVMKIGEQSVLQCSSVMHHYDASFEHGNRAGMELDSDKCKYSQTGEIGILKEFAGKLHKKDAPAKNNLMSLIQKWNYLIDAGMNLDREGLPVRESDQCIVEWMANTIYRRYHADDKQLSASPERDIAE